MCVKNSDTEGAPRHGTGAVRLSDEMTPRYTGWRVVVACFVMAVFCWGFGFYGQGVYLAALSQKQQWNVALISGASTAYYLFSAVLVIFVGGAMTRFGPRRVVLTGVVCLAVSTALVGQVDAPWQLYVDYALMSFGWATMSVAAITTIVGAWFDQRRGLAITLALTGASVGGVVVTPVLVLLIGHIGLAPALLYGVIVMLVVLVPMVLAWVRSPAEMKAPTGPTSTAGCPGTRRRALSDVGFWSVSAACALVLFVQVGFFVLQIDFLTPRIGASEASIAVAVTAASAVIGRLCLGGVIDRLDPRLASAVSYFSQAAALLGMVWTTNAAALLIACAVYGFSVGNVLVFPTLVIQREFAAAAFPVLVSLTMAITQFVYALGPGALGFLRDATGSYYAPLMLCAALELLAVVIVLIRGRPRPESEDKSAALRAQ
jgi:MFS family permease